MTLEGKGLRICRNKIDYNIEYDFGGRDQVVDGTKLAMTISDDVKGEVKSFKYYGSFVQRDEGFDVNVKHRISVIG